MMSRFFRFLFLCVPVLLLFGCGKDDIPANYPASVKVNYKGAPLEDATVILHPDGHDSPSPNCKTDSAGFSKLFSYKGKGKGVIPGKYNVTIIKTEVPEPEKQLRPGDPGYPAPPKPARTPKSLIPEKYAKAAESGLSCEVTSDKNKNEFTFDLSEE